MSTRVPDAWDDDKILQSDDFPPLSKVVRPTKEKVRDEWDEDDEDDKVLEEVASNQRANQLATPVILKPQVVSLYNGGSTGSSFPPELSFEPAVRILKRPKPTGAQSSNSSSANNDRKTLQEREEKYRQARERIFGSASPSPSVPSTPKQESSPVGVVEEQLSGTREDQPERRASPATFARPVREPLGPGTHPGFARKPVSERNTGTLSSPKAS